MNIIVLSFIVFLYFNIAHAKDIDIQNLVDYKAINCQIFGNPESKMAVLLRDFSGDGQKNIKLNKLKQTLTIDSTTYHGVEGYKYYKTKNSEQEDFAVNFDVFGVKVIKIALQNFKAQDYGESGSFYFIFKGSPIDVTHKMRKALGSNWGMENTLAETPQGNAKLTCIYIG